jgi:hypothetical protein
MEVSKAEFIKLETSVHEIKETLNQVHGAIIGNPLSKDGGMSERLIEAENKLIELEQRLDAAEKKQIKYNVYTIIMWTCIGATAMAIFVYAMQLFFK